MHEIRQNVAESSAAKISRQTSGKNFQAGFALLAILLAGSFAAGCVSQPKPAPQFATANESLEELEAPQCVNQESQPVECHADSDCCTGFVCGKDPELSRRKTFCMYGG